MQVAAAGVIALVVTTGVVVLLLNKATRPRQVIHDPCVISTVIGSRPRLANPPGNRDAPVVDLPNPTDMGEAQVLVARPQTPTGLSQGTEFPQDMPGVSDGSVTLPIDAELSNAFRKAIMSGDFRLADQFRGRFLQIGEPAVAYLKPLIRCGNVVVEIEGIRLLSQIGGEDALVHAFARVLVVPRDDPAYGLYLAAFADNRSPVIAEWLAGTLGKTQSADARGRILDLIAVMHGPVTVEAIANAATSPADDLHRKDALEGLATRQDPSETQALAGLLDRQDQASRVAAASGLASVGTSDACLILADRVAQDSEVSPVCAIALATVDSSYGQETLLSLATDQTRHVNVRMSALQALETHTGTRVRGTLENAILQETEPPVIAAMKKTLETIAQKHSQVQNSSAVPYDDAGELW